jgi:hypothetical protein
VLYVAEGLELEIFVVLDITVAVIDCGGVEFRIVDEEGGE